MKRKKKTDRKRFNKSEIDLMNLRYGLSTFAPDASSQLNVFRHDGDPFGVNGA